MFRKSLDHVVFHSEFFQLDHDLFPDAFGRRVNKSLFNFFARLFVNDVGGHAEFGFVVGLAYRTGVRASFVDLGQRPIVPEKNQRTEISIVITKKLSKRREIIMGIFKGSLKDHFPFFVGIKKSPQKKVLSVEN